MTDGKKVVSCFRQLSVRGWAIVGRVGVFIFIHLELFTKVSEVFLFFFAFSSAAIYFRATLWVICSLAL